MDLKLSNQNLRILLILLVIFNLIVAGFLLLDIQAFQAPKTNVKINIIDVSSEEMVLETIVDIKNPNNFDLSIKAQVSTIKG